MSWVRPSATIQAWTLRPLATSFKSCLTRHPFVVKARILGAAGCDIAASARIHSRARFEGSSIAVGDDTWIGAEVFVAATPNAPIQIGSRVDIAPRVTFVVGSHDLGPAHRRAGAGKSLPITIGHGTWIGAGALILGA